MYSLWKNNLIKTNINEFLWKESKKELAFSIDKLIDIYNLSFDTYRNSFLIFHKIKKKVPTNLNIKEDKLSISCIIIVLKFLKNKNFVENFIKTLDRNLINELQKYEEIILLLINFDLEKDLLFDELNNIFNSKVMEDVTENNKILFYNNLEKILLDVYKNPEIINYNTNLIAVSIFIFLSNYLAIKIKINKFVNNFRINEINEIIKNLFSIQYKKFNN